MISELCSGCSRVKGFSLSGYYSYPYRQFCATILHHPFCILLIYDQKLRFSYLWKIRFHVLWLRQTLFGVRDANAVTGGRGPVR
jgi:hypothetical protein